LETTPGIHSGDHFLPSDPRNVVCRFTPRDPEERKYRRLDREDVM
jgi:hypothetical protein